MPNIDLSILNQRQTPAFYADVFANRPAAGFIGRIFVSTDTFAFYRDNGTGWDLIGGPGTGTITGSGASGQIALWDGASTITGDTGLTYDGTDNSLTASKFIVTGGTSSQFLKGDGTLDSSVYLTDNIYNSNGSLTAERTINLNAHNLIFDGGASVARLRLDADTNVARIFSFASNNLPRWAFRIDGTESGSDAGSDFAIRRYNDAGAFVDAPLTVTRSTGQSTFAKKVVIENNAGDQQLQVVSTTAPSIRLDNTQTGATKRAGLGISTAVNNFIQGSADRDFCMFNGSTTASPILFGVYDAGLTNTQEAARISPARNFLIGTTTDSGYKLNVNGTAYFQGNVTLKNTLFIENTGNSDVTEIFMSPSTFNTFIDYPSGRSLVLRNKGSLATTTLSSTGDVAIGSTSVTNSRLEVNTPGTNLNEVALRLRNTSTSASSISTLYFQCGYTNDVEAVSAIAGNRSGGGNNAFLTFITSIGGTLSEGMRLTTSNNLLIGTTTDAGQKLQVNGNAAITGQFSAINSVSTDFIATFQNTNSNSYGVIIKGSATAINGYPLLSVNDSTGASVYFRVDSGTGNVAIKTTPGTASSFRIAGLPTSSAGLASGEVWNDSGTLKIA